MVMIRKPVEPSRNLQDRRLEAAENARALALYLQRKQRERILREAREAKAQMLIVESKIILKK